MSNPLLNIVVGDALDLNLKGPRCNFSSFYREISFRKSSEINVFITTAIFATVAEVEMVLPFVRKLVPQRKFKKVS